MFLNMHFHMTLLCSPPRPVMLFAMPQFLPAAFGITDPGVVARGLHSRGAHSMGLVI